MALTAPDVAVEMPVQDPVVARTAEEHAELALVDNEVVAFVAEDDVFLVSTRDGIVASAAFDHIGTGKVRDDVIAETAFDVVGAVAALNSIVAVAPIKRIVADTADDRIRTVSTADRYVIPSRVLDEAGRIGDTDVSRHFKRIADHERKKGRVAHGICRRPVARLVELLALVHLQEMIRNREEAERQDARTRIAQIRVAHGNGGEWVRLKRREHRDGTRAEQVVEAVAVLQGLHLVLEDEVMCRAEITRKWAALLR